ASATLLFTAAAVSGDNSPPPPTKPLTPDQVTFFEKNIRPVLATKCYSCHSAEAKSLKGGLRLDTREGLRQGGNSGPILVGGNPKKSLLIKAMRHEEKDLQMPPKEKLPDTVIADFEHWVRIGAPDPRTGGAPVVRAGIDIEKARQFWAFRPPQRQEAPQVRDV